MGSFIIGCLVSAACWHVLDNYTTIPTFWKWIIVFIVLMCL